MAHGNEGTSRRVSSRLKAAPKKQANYVDDLPSDVDMSEDEKQFDAASRKKRKVPEPDEFDDDDFVKNGTKTKSRTVKGKGKAKAKDTSFDISILPIEILIMIMSQCEAKDLLSLAKVNKSMLKTLSHCDANKLIWEPSRRAHGIWIVPDVAAANANAEADMPDAVLCHYPNPPPGLSELKYAALVFGRNCSLCTSTKSSPFFAFGVRLCGSCKRENVRTLSQLLTSGLVSHGMLDASRCETGAGRSWERLYLTTNISEMLIDYAIHSKMQDTAFSTPASVPRDNMKYSDTVEDEITSNKMIVEGNEDLPEGHLEGEESERPNIKTESQGPLAEMSDSAASSTFDAARYLAEKKEDAKRMAEFAIQCQKHEKELEKVRAEDHEQKMAAFKNAFIDFGVSIGHDRGDIEEILERHWSIGRRLRVAKVFNHSHWQSLRPAMKMHLDKTQKYRRAHQTWLETAAARNTFEFLYETIKAEQDRKFFPNRATFYSLEAVAALLEKVQNLLEKMTDGQEDDVQQDIYEMGVSHKRDIDEAIDEWETSLKGALNAKLDDFSRSITLEHPFVRWRCERCRSDFATPDILAHSCIARRADHPSYYIDKESILRRLDRVFDIDFVKVDRKSMNAWFIVQDAVAKLMPKKAASLNANNVAKVKGHFTCVSCGGAHRSNAGMYGLTRRTEGKLVFRKSVDLIQHLAFQHPLSLTARDGSVSVNVTFEPEAKVAKV